MHSPECIPETRPRCKRCAPSLSGRALHGMPCRPHIRSCQSIDHFEYIGGRERREKLQKNRNGFRRTHKKLWTQAPGRCRVAAADGRWSKSCGLVLRALIHQPSSRDCCVHIYLSLSLSLSIYLSIYLSTYLSISLSESGCARSELTGWRADPRGLSDGQP